ncbi:ROK family protein [Ideonella sp. DXS29W]|uniref:ROK family protein n=1 Tax=Ideonella lacteola TaxID=2984193 RepID=A0ABU9BKV5_9BURK
MNSSPDLSSPRTSAIGIDLGGTKTEVIVLDADGHERWRRRLPTPGGDYSGTVATVVGLVNQARRELRLADATIGAGTPGSLTPQGLIKNANSTCLNGRPLQRDLSEALGQAVAMANDANCLALSEATDGAGAGAGVVFAVILGTGVGGGIAVHGRVLGGPNGLAGEWGHNPLPWATEADPRWACYCGQAGCIEMLVSGPGLARDHHGGLGGPTAAEIAGLAAAGDPIAQAAMARHAERLARALSHVINLLDPDVVVLGGGLSRVASLYEAVPRLWGRHVFAAGAAGQALRTRLLPAVHGDSSGVRGAAWLGRAAGTRLA